MVEKGPNLKFETDEQLRNQIAGEIIRDLANVFLDYPFVLDWRHVILATQPWEHFVNTNSFDHELKQFPKKSGSREFTKVTDNDLYIILKDIRARITEMASARITRYISEGAYVISKRSEEQVRAALISSIVNSINGLLKNLQPKVTGRVA